MDVEESQHLFELTPWLVAGIIVFPLHTRKRKAAGLSIKLNLRLEVDFTRHALSSNTRSNPLIIIDQAGPNASTHDLYHFLSNR